MIATPPEEKIDLSHPAMAEIETLADLLHLLGDIPLDRVLLKPALGTATEADVVALAEGDRKRLCELIDGVLVEKAMGAPESGIAIRLAMHLSAFILTKNLGIILGADGMIRLQPGRVRVPDLAFIAWDRLPNRIWPTEPILQVAPNLSIEILSRSNTPKEMRNKRIEYFLSGVEQVWEIEPIGRTARVFTAVDEFQTLQGADDLDGGSVLPGFKLSLATLFGELDRTG